MAPNLGTRLYIDVIKLIRKSMYMKEKVRLLRSDLVDPRLRGIFAKHNCGVLYQPLAPLTTR
jgi:hypothetical protein